MTVMDVRFAQGLPGESPWPVDAYDSGEREYAHAVQTVTASGDTTVITPATGKAIRLHWIYALADPNVSMPIIDIKLGASAIFRVFGISKRQLKTGAVNAPLVVSLSEGGRVAVTVIYEEV